jgi:hypothetical protein
MKAFMSDAMRMEIAQTPTAPLPVRVAKLLWEHLPLLIFASALLYLAALPVLAAWMFGLPLLAPWIAVLTIGPTWQGIALGTRALLKGEEVNWRVLLKISGQNWLRAVRIGALPALLLSVFMATNTILASYPREGWLYVPLFLDGGLSTLALLAGLTAFSLPARHLRGWKLWAVALAVTRLQMAKQLGILVLFAVLGALIALIFNASFLPLLCVPCVVCLEMLTGQTCVPLVDSQGQE